MGNKAATGKKMVERDWQMAFALMFNPVISIEESKEKGDSTLNEIFSQNEETPETLLLKKERFYSLGEEARDLITTIINGPAEIFELISSPKHHVISKTSIKKYLKQKGLNSFKIELCFKELANFTKQL